MIKSIKLYHCFVWLIHGEKTRQSCDLISVHAVGYYLTTTATPIRLATKDVHRPTHHKNGSSRIIICVFLRAYVLIIMVKYLLDETDNRFIYYCTHIYILQVRKQVSAQQRKQKTASSLCALVLQYFNGSHYTVPILHHNFRRLCTVPIITYEH